MSKFFKKHFSLIISILIFVLMFIFFNFPTINLVSSNSYSRVITYVSGWNMFLGGEFETTISSRILTTIDDIQKYQYTSETIFLELKHNIFLQFLCLLPLLTGLGFIFNYFLKENSLTKRVLSFTITICFALIFNLICQINLTFKQSIIYMLLIISFLIFLGKLDKNESHNFISGMLLISGLTLFFMSAIINYVNDGFSFILAPWGIIICILFMSLGIISLLYGHIRQKVDLKKEGIYYDKKESKE